MKINKLKFLSVAVCCAVTALWSEAQCMDPPPVEPDDPIKNIKIYQVEEEFKNKSMTEKVDLIFKVIPELYNKIDNIKQENIEIKNENFKLKEKTIYLEKMILLSEKYFYGDFWNINHDRWENYAVQQWEPLRFNQFSGDERLRGNLSVIDLPEDGVYSLRVHYHWKAVNGVAAPSTGIALKDSKSFNGCYSTHYLEKNLIASNIVNRVQRFKKGDKVMVSILGHQNAEYHLNSWSFRIEKLIS